MDLKFEVKDLILRRKDTNVLIDDYSEDIYCYFNFITDQWNGKEKFIIFWDSHNKTFIKSLGVNKSSKCIIPRRILKRNTIFQIQIYIDNKIKTQKLKIATVPQGYTIEKRSNKKHKKHKNHEKDTKKIFRKIFTQLENKIDKIDYVDGYLKAYAGETVVFSTPIFRDFQVDIQSEIKDLMPYFEVDERTGNLYVIYPYDDVRHLNNKE